MLLLGRDIIRVHKVHKQVNGPHNLPYAQKLDLGWVIVGNVCLGNFHKPLTIRTFHTITTEPNRPTLFDPCPIVFHVKETYKDNQILLTTPQHILWMNLSVMLTTWDAPCLSEPKMTTRWLLRFRTPLS